MRRSYSALWLLGLLFPVALFATSSTTQPATTDQAQILAWIEEGRLREAEATLRELARETPGSEVFELLGLVQSRQQRFDDARTSFRRALEITPGRLPVLQQLARLELLQGRQGEALQILRQAAATGPLDRRLALQLALLELAAGRPEAAETQLVSIAERFESPRALLLLARIAADRGETERARLHLEKALEIAPNSEEILLTRAELALTTRDYLGAILALDPLVRMLPREAKPIYLLGVARLQLGALSSAIETLERALPLQPRSAQAHFALGLAFGKRNRFTEARDALERALVLEPDFLEAQAALAEAEEGLGHLETAERLAARVLERSGGHATAHWVLGRIHMQQGRYEAARDAFAAAVQLDPGQPRLHYQLSLALARLNDREGSRQQLELYRAAQKRIEEQLEELARRTGTGPGGGMGP